jgi:hypothetical protein
MQYKSSLITLVFCLAMLSCKPKPEFYIDGRGYYTETKCDSGEWKTVYDYHYGFWLGKNQFHYGPRTTYECYLYKTDTLQIPLN